MGYEKLDDVVGIQLGGINKKTGKKNPMELEGYFLRTETRPNKYNPVKPQNFYVFKNEQGEVGLFGKGGLDREMRKATVGRMTKVVDTGETIDVGKGNPMKVFSVFQDSSNAIDVSAAAAQEEWSDDSELSESTYEEEISHEVAPPAPQPPKAAALVDTERKARMQALLSRGKTK